jgi:hypothetical protein
MNALQAEKQNDEYHHAVDTSAAVTVAGAVDDKADDAAHQIGDWRSHDNADKTFSQ